MISGKTLIKMEEMEFRLLNDLINDYCGLYFTDGRLEILQSRLQNRLHFYNFNSFLEYYHFIKYDADREKELKELIDVLTNNETYFFREKKQLESFSRTVLRELR
jgi:chemotaxis protein methyltransferase CheR